MRKTTYSTFHYLRCITDLTLLTVLLVTLHYITTITIHYLQKNSYKIIYTDTQSYNTLLTFKKKIIFLIFLTMEEKKNYTASTPKAHPHTSPSPTHTRY